MKINFNAPFWRLLRQVKYYLGLIIILLALIFLTSITIVKGLDNNQAYQERVYEQHRLVWEVE